MKYILIIVFLPFISHAQIDDIMEDFSPPKTVFHKNQFGPKQRYDCLKEVLEYGKSFLSDSITSLTSKAEDLYYDKSEPNEYTENLNKLFLTVNVYPKEQIENEIISFFNQNQLNKEWLAALDKFELDREILAYEENYKVKLEHNSLYLYSTYEDRTYMYVYKFNKKNQLVFNGYGYHLVGREDTALWKQTHYSYKKNALKIIKKEQYDDSNYRRAYLKDKSIVVTDSEVNEYKKGILIKGLKTKFDNLKVIYTEEKEYSYNKQNDIVKVKKDQLGNNNKLHGTIISTFKDNKLQQQESVNYNQDNEIYSKSKLENIFNKDGNLQKLSFEEKDKDGKVIKRYTKEYEYYSNHLILIYKDEIYTPHYRGNLPLMYQYSFKFY